MSLIFTEQIARDPLLLIPILCIDSYLRGIELVHCIAESDDVRASESDVIGDLDCSKLLSQKAHRRNASRATVIAAGGLSYVIYRPP